MAPRKGAETARRIPATALARPSRAVLTTASVPWEHQVLKKTGKKPDMTVVAKAEFAKS
jgi:hypothetical protein